MSNIGQDIGYAFRTMRKAPAFTLVALATLAFGIGANTAVFTLVNAIFLHPLPVRDPQHVVSIYTILQQKNRGGFGNYLPVSFPNGQDVQHQAKSLAELSLFINAPVSMSVEGKADRLTLQLTSGNFFDLLGVHAALGRTFRPEEDLQPGAGPVIVLSHGAWQRRFGANRDVIGKNVLLNGQGFTIIGVAPAGFQGTSVLAGPDMWVPLSMHDQLLAPLQKTYFNERRALLFSIAARLKPDVDIEQSRAELKTISAGLEKAFPLQNKGRVMTALPLLQAGINPNLRGTFVRAGALLMTVVGLVLLIGCANIANLLLARATARKREISIRLAMGASRLRVLRQLLTESLVLAILGGALGLGLGILGRNLLWQFRPPFLQQTDIDLALDGTVLLFTFLAALGTGIVFGLVPALQFSRPDLTVDLKDRVGGDLHARRKFWLNNSFVILEVALSCVALVGAGLFLLSLRNAQEVDPGFDTHNLAMLSFDLGSLNYDPARMKEFDRRVLEAVSSAPGMKSATLSSAVPLFFPGIGRSIFPEGEEQAAANQNGVLISMASVASGYFETMGIPIKQGMTFDSSVREDSPKVAIINEEAARRFWPGKDPLGKRIKFYGSEDWIQVIGVSRNSKYTDLGEEPTPYLYVPLIQNPSPSLTLFFRSNSSPEAELSTVRSEVQELDRSLPLTNVWPIGEVISQSLWSARCGAALLSIFAVVALFLCAIGIYGVVGYTVDRRVREIGIRMALGAHRRDVLFMVLRQSAAMVGAGLITGIAASLVLSRFIVSLLYGISANAPAPFIGMAITLSLVGLLASYIPARRATAVDPIVALRQD